MKKLISKTDLKKKQQRNQLIGGIVLIVVMLFSTIAYSFMDNNSASTSSSNVMYNGVKFTNQENYFLGEKYSNQILLLNNPKKINQEIPTNFSITSANYFGKPLYISSSDYLVEWQLNQVLGQSVNKIAQRVQKACYNEKNCPDNYPIKSCTDNLIIVEYSNFSEINSVGNCIIISGPAENISQISDLFLLKLFEI